MQGYKLQRFFLVIGMCLLLAACNFREQGAANNKWSEFYGTYKGNAENVVIGEMKERELTVVIKPWKDKGFTVEWVTVISRDGGATKNADMSIDFYPSERSGMYASAMTTDLFGQATPFNPMGADADPYVWAGLEGKTLTVSALYVIDGGGFEMQVYKRTINDEGLFLEFERLNNGEKIAQVSAQLQKVS